MLYTVFILFHTLNIKELKRELSPHPLGQCWTLVPILTISPHFKTFQTMTFQGTGVGDWPLEQLSQLPALQLESWQLWQLRS